MGSICCAPVATLIATDRAAYDEQGYDDNADFDDGKDIAGANFPVVFGPIQ